MRRLAPIILFLLVGCIHRPDRVIISYQRDPDTGDEKIGFAVSLPVVWE